MGFEKKILFILTSQTKGEIQELLENQKDFFLKEYINKNLNFEYRNNKTNKGIPDVTVVIEEDGLYICQYCSSKDWEGIFHIKKYLQAQNINFNIEEI